MSKIILIYKKSKNFDNNSPEKDYLYFLDETVDVKVFKLPEPVSSKKLSAKDKKQFLNDLLPQIVNSKSKILFVADGEITKTLLKVTKVENLYGYSYKAKYEGYEDFNVIPVPNVDVHQYNTQYLTYTHLSQEALKAQLANSENSLGTNIIHSGIYPESISDIKNNLDSLLDKPILAVDIEAFSLKYTKAGIGSIAFAYSEHDGISFTVDIHRDKSESIQIRELLSDFFINYKGKLVFHRGAYDVTVLVYNLFMKNKLDNYSGMFQGLNYFFRDFEDTMVMAYLCLNSTQRAMLSLKVLAYEFAGNYAVDVEDINLLSKDVLLEYGLKDVLATMYVYNKYLPKLIEEDQQDVYVNLFLPSQRNIVNMQLVGLPLDISKVTETDIELKNQLNVAYENIMKDKYISLVETNLKRKKMYAKNEKLKTKQVTEDDFSDNFNPNSNDQLIDLLYNFHALPVLDTTDTGQPSTGAKSLEKLINFTTNLETKNLLKNLIDFIKINKILTTFIPAFLNSANINGYHFLHGNYKLGGTVSGRLCSFDVNLQNIPATGSPYAKVIKKCFAAPPGWIMVGLDFSALEMFIDTVITNDPVKLDILLAGYDPHAFNTYYYWKDKFTDIHLLDNNILQPYRIIDNTTGELSYSVTVPNKQNITVEDCDYKEYNKYYVSYIKDNFEELRTKSKPVSFALQYKGTEMTLVRNSGFAIDEAKQIVSNYQNLYKVSIEYSNNRILKAQKDGFIRLAFGLKLRTPTLKGTVLFSDYTPSNVEKDVRTIGNAISQSWGLLNNRAANEVDTELDKPENIEYRESTLPIAHVHDAQYYMVKADAKYIAKLNDLLQKAVVWNKHPDIYHDKVAPSGQLSIFYPSWATELKIPKVASPAEIKKLFKEHLKKLEEK